MSLKDRLNINTQIKAPSLKETVENVLYMDFFEKALCENLNILLYCPINVPTYEALNSLCVKIPQDKRIVMIGNNLELKQKEVIKFEPDTNNSSKNLIKTAVNLNPYKIILQNFQGVEAVDIFKFINADIKNIITAVTASDAKKALTQMEFNLYSGGLNIPENLMKNMIADFTDLIIQIEKLGTSCTISKISKIKSIRNNQYLIEEISINKKTGKKTIVKTEISTNEDKFGIKGFERVITAEEAEPDILQKKLTKPEKKPLKKPSLAKLKRKK